MSKGRRNQSASDDDDDLFIIRLDPKFPLEDVEAIGARLTASGALVPAYVPPNDGLLSIVAFRLNQDIYRSETRLLPDRNLVSRMARLARDGAEQPLAGPTAIAADLMAFAQAMNLLIEPSIAFHELAHRDGNAIALEELSWFRAADHGQAMAWIDLAQGRVGRLPIAIPKPQAERDLAYPLNRWRRNYVVALKIAGLELSSSTPVERALMLFRWMADDFFVAGPAAIFATMYFAPLAARRRLIKQLRSPDRARAIAGIRNAAWDITHLSNLVAERKRSEKENIFFIFATADRGLAEIAPVLMIDADGDACAPELARSLSAWWPAPDALCLAETLFGYIRRARNRRADAPAFSNDRLQMLIDSGEAYVRAWSGDMKSGP
jgi:hypothetical protein